MKKVMLLCLEDDRDRSLDALRDLGVLHLAPIKEPESADLDKTRVEFHRAQSALGILNAYLKEEMRDSAQARPLPQSGPEIVSAVHELTARRKELSEKLEYLHTEKAATEPFGNFNPMVIKELAEKGITVELYHVSSKKPVVPPDGTELFVIRRDSTGQYCAIVGKGSFDFAGNEFPVPKRSLAEVVDDLKAANSELRDVENELYALSGLHKSVENLVSDLTEKVQYIEAQEGMGSARKLSYLQGFCPVDLIDRLRKTAAKQGWGLVIEDPSAGDDVPTSIRYPKWALAIRPVFKFLGIVPGYRETDVSPAFMVFLSIFFAMIVGDAGYGVLLLLLGGAARRKFRHAPAEPFRLLNIFCGCTILWGILTANYFAIPYEALPAILRSIRIDWLMNQGNSMTCSLLLGAIHLTLAHVWKAVTFGRNPQALTQLGWVCITWTMFMVARLLLVNAALPSWFVVLPVVGLIAIVAGIVMSREWVKLVLLGQEAIGSFGDLISYLRLFALGIASIKVAEAFNDMAGQFGVLLAGLFDHPLLTWLGIALAAIAMAVVLILGHGLNVLLCGMSVLVHGVRLNALEFSLHMGQEWSGFKYAPFAKSEV